MQRNFPFSEVINHLKVREAMKYFPWQLAKKDSLPEEETESQISKLKGISTGNGRNFS